MLKFNQYPPVEPGDVELTDEGKRTILLRATAETFRNKDMDETFGFFGVVVGQLIAANVEIQEPREMTSASYRIAQPIFDDVNQIAGRDLGRAFQSGFDGGVLAEQYSEPQQVGAKHV